MEPLTYLKKDSFLNSVRFCGIEFAEGKLIFISDIFWGLFLSSGWLWARTEVRCTAPQGNTSGADGFLRGDSGSWPGPLSERPLRGGGSVSPMGFFVVFLVWGGWSPQRDVFRMPGGGT